MKSETEHSVAEAPQSNSLSSDRSKRETNRLAKRGPRIKPLSREQEAALAAIAAGKSAAAAAIDAGVHQGTLYRWLKEDPSFSAAYHTWQNECRESARGRLMALTDNAVSAVSNAIDKQDIRTALTILKGLGVLTPVTPGSTDAQEHKRERELAQRNKENQLSLDEAIASTGM